MMRWTCLRFWRTWELYWAYRDRYSGILCDISYAFLCDNCRGVWHGTHIKYGHGTHLQYKYGNYVGS